MSRTILLAILLSCATGAWAQPPRATDGGTTDAQGRKQGAWTRTWPRTGTLRYTGAFKDDKPVGEFRHYDEDGHLTTVQQYAADGRTSRAEHFHPNGRLMATGRYVGQAKDSVWNFYDEAGRLRRTEGYQAGTLHGARISYFEDGTKASEEPYEHGLLHGVHRTWYTGGRQRMEAPHVKGVPEGRTTFWYPKGTKELEGDMRDGVRDGTWFYYNEDGSLRMQALYRRGELVKEKRENGTFTEHYDEDRIKSEVTYVKGLREGRFVEYHDNGQWVMEKVPADEVRGVPAFEHRVLRGQTRKIEGTYKNDRLHGEVKEYDEKGRLLKTRRYVDGVEQ